MQTFGRMVRSGFVLGGAVALAACGPASDETAVGGDTEVFVPPVSEGPPAAFAQCVSCHSVKPGVNGVGPSLHGVVGRTAGTVPGYAYSDALKAWGKQFDEPMLHQYLTAPMKVVPGTKMVFPGMPDAERRQAVIDYLETLK
jgi:cytochrome c